MINLKNIIIILFVVFLEIYRVTYPYGYVLIFILILYIQLRRFNLKSLGIIVILWICSCLAYAEDCRIYTEEQEAILTLAYEVGSPHDLGLTLAAIVQQESFVGPYIVRDNPKDGNYGSYGLSHITLETAQWLTGIDNIWEARSYLIPRLISDDKFALNLAVAKLKSIKGSEIGFSEWQYKVYRYNGTGERAKVYLRNIVRNVNSLKRCRFFIKEFIFGRT